jgi:hypothetical protein
MAEMAVKTRHMMMQCDAVAGLEPPEARTNFYNGAGGFVAENARGRHGAVLDFFDVGGADAADGHPDQQFIRANARDGHGFEAQIVHAVINDGTHGLWDDEHAEI